MAHLTIVTKRSSMIHRSIQKNVFTVLPSKSSMTNCSTSRMPTIYDDSLTNLSWLHDINILKRTIPTINSSNHQHHHHQQELINEKEKESSSAYSDEIDDLNICNDEQWRMYRNNPHLKPIYSYSQLILLALKQSGHDKMTLQMIYEWVAENFPYFKKMEPTWQNSIRHNLSLNKHFVKVARTKKENGGKGGFWKLSPDYDRKHFQNTSTISNLSNSPPNKRSRPSKRFNDQEKSSIQHSSMNDVIKSETWIDPVLPSKTFPTNYVRMPSSLLSPISSPDSLPLPPFQQQQQQQQINDFASILTPSPSSSPSSMSKQNFLPTKLDETDMLLLDAATFDWDAYLSETTTDIDVQPLLCTKTEQDLFNEFNAALTDLTSSAEAGNGTDSNAFDGFDYPIKSSTFQTLFEDDEQQSSLTIKGRGIKRPVWWLNNDSLSPTKLPSLETAFDLKLTK